ncbi:MAG: IS3 family transposase [Verrucomicrobiales bacterium]|nr:IS3 family transposase [Verrucomicrobiales bacterium]
MLTPNYSQQQLSRLFPRRPRCRNEQALHDQIKTCFTAGRNAYGCRRICRSLRQQQVRCGKNRIYRLMRELGLRAKCKRRFKPQTTDSAHHRPVAENLLKTVPPPAGANQVWVADITYIPTKEGWLYLAGMLDLCTRQCVGWHMDDNRQMTWSLAPCGAPVTDSNPARD